MGEVGPTLGTPGIGRPTTVTRSLNTEGKQAIPNPRPRASSPSKTIPKRTCRASSPQNGEGQELPSTPCSTPISPHPMGTPTPIGTVCDKAQTKGGGTYKQLIPRQAATRRIVLTTCGHVAHLGRWSRFDPGVPEGERAGVHTPSTSLPGLQGSPALPESTFKYF